jgi:hypothetical protein
MVQSWKNRGDPVQMKNEAQVMKRKKNEASAKVPKAIEAEVRAKMQGGDLKA